MGGALGILFVPENAFVSVVRDYPPLLTEFDDLRAFHPRLVGRHAVELGPTSRRSGTATPARDVSIYLGLFRIGEFGAFPKLLSARQSLGRALAL